MCGELCDGVPCPICEPDVGVYSAIEGGEIRLCLIDFTEDRLLVLSCKHLVLMSDADNMFPKMQAYDSSGFCRTIAETKAAMGEGEFFMPKCLFCNNRMESVNGRLNRYSRLFKIFKFDVSEKRFAALVAPVVNEATAILNEIRNGVRVSTLDEAEVKVEQLKKLVRTQSPFASLTRAIIVSSHDDWEPSQEVVPLGGLAAQISELELFFKAVKVATASRQLDMGEWNRQFTGVLAVVERGLKEADDANAPLTRERIVKNAFAALSALLSPSRLDCSRADILARVKKFFAARTREEVFGRCCDVWEGFQELKKRAEHLKVVSPLSLEDILRIMPNLRERGLASHVKRCPNGHIYFVGDCGGAMELGHCNECGAVIGGRDHRNAAGNVDVPIAP